MFGQSCPLLLSTKCHSPDKAPCRDHNSYSSRSFDGFWVKRLLYQVAIGIPDQLIPCLWLALAGFASRWPFACISMQSSSSNPMFQLLCSASSCQVPLRSMIMSDPLSGCYLPVQFISPHFLKAKGLASNGFLLSVDLASNDGGLHLEAAVAGVRPCLAGEPHAAV